MVDHEVAELVEAFLVVADGDRERLVREDFAAVVRAQDLDVVRRDRVEAQQRRFRAERRDPLAVVAR